MTTKFHWLKTYYETIKLVYFFEQDKKFRSLVKRLAFLDCPEFKFHFSFRSALKVLKYSIAECYDDMDAYETFVFGLLGLLFDNDYFLRHNVKYLSCLLSEKSSLRKFVTSFCRKRCPPDSKVVLIVLDELIAQRLNLNTDDYVFLRATELPEQVANVSLELTAKNRLLVFMYQDLLIIEEGSPFLESPVQIYEPVAKQFKEFVSALKIAQV